MFTYIQECEYDVNRAGPLAQGSSPWGAAGGKLAENAMTNARLRRPGTTDAGTELGGAMSYLVLLGSIVLIGLLNLTAELLQYLASPYGLLGGFILVNLLLCAFAPVCPPTALMRSLCTKAGCLPR